MEADDAPLMCTQAKRCITKYTKGQTVIPIEQLGVSPPNRIISPVYVHELGAHSMETGGFSKERD